MLDIESLVKKENWELITRDDSKIIIAEGQEFPLRHPFDVHAKLYRAAPWGDKKYRHLKAMYDYAFPQRLPTWHYWKERRFREFCEDYKYISWAGGASTTKSYDAGELGYLEWMSYPKGKTVLFASTTLNSLERRIWGYVLKCLKESQVSFKYHYSRSKPPQVLYNRDDLQHGMFAVAAKKGDDDQAISDWIGRHPTHGLTLFLDEGTDMPIAGLGAMPNLEKGQAGQFKCVIIGNSNSKYDLHGIMSTPKNGWESIDPMKDNKWQTTQDKGICLFFNCYESPAIYETNPEKKALLSKFLITKKQIEQDERTLGKNSVKFYRFTLGFWMADGTESTVISRSFLKNFTATAKTEWSPYTRLKVLGGLDPAFSYGGDKCILRLAYFGFDINGQYVLDYKGGELLFDIKPQANSDKSIELQIVDECLAILKEFNVSLKDFGIDCSGQGRALAEVFRLRLGTIDHPLKLYSVQSFSVNKVKKAAAVQDMTMISNYELWYDLRRFIETNNIRGLDLVTVNQLVTRLVVEENGKVILEKKADYRKRMGAISPTLAASPDEADGASIVLQVAMRNYGFYPGQVHVAQATEDVKGSHLAKTRNLNIEVKKEPSKIITFGSGFTAELGRGVGEKNGLMDKVMGQFGASKSPFRFK